MKPCRHGHLDGALHRPCYQCRAEAAEHECALVRDALRTLLDLKAHKDKHGKDAHYEAEQPRAWARAALALHGLLVGDVPTFLTPNAAVNRASGPKEKP